MAAMLAIAISIFASAASAANEHSPLMRQEEGIRRVAIDTHSHLKDLDLPAAKQVSGLHVDLPVSEGGENDEAASMSEGSSVEDPCSFLGCNSPKCAWASGGVITRLVAKKACSNALVVGTGDAATPAAATPGVDTGAVAGATASLTTAGAKNGAAGPLAGATSVLTTAGAQTGTTAASLAADAPAASSITMMKITTLKECMNAVRAQNGASCKGEFQLHKDTLTCSCVPTGASCTEVADENVCRYQVVAQ